MISLFAFWGAMELGLIYGLVALGVYISFRILDFPDLTVDGSFTTGGSVAAVMIVSGYDPVLACVMAILASALAGVVTAILNVRFGVMNLLASILVMTGLYSINLRIMGVPNIPVFGDDIRTLFNIWSPVGIDESVYRVLILFAIVLLFKMFFDWFFSTQIGLAMRSTGSNLRMARAQGISTNGMIILGMAISNGLVGLAGALFVQTQGGSDLSMGIGTIVIGLAAVIIGESLFKARRMFFITLSVVIGALLYRLFIAFALNTHFLGLQAQDLNLMTAVLVTLVLILPKLYQSGIKAILPKK